MPDIPVAAQADIAFVLTIFFLVATTMHVDSGITRVLPPYVDPTVQQDMQVEVRERDLLAISINRGGSVMAQGQPISINQLKDLVKEFVLNPRQDENMSGTNDTEIDLLGVYPVSSAVISLKTDRGTSYSTYIAVQNELTRALNEMRDDLARNKFGRDYSNLAQPQRDAIAAAIKNNISEAEPIEIGGN